MGRAPPSMLPHSCDKLWDNKTKGGLFSTELVSLIRSLFHLRGTFGLLFLGSQEMLLEKTAKNLTHILIDGGMHLSIAILLWTKPFERYHQLNKINVRFVSKFFFSDKLLSEFILGNIWVFFLLFKDTVLFSSNHQ